MGRPECRAGFSVLVPPSTFKENAIKENIMHKLKVLSAALALLVVTPVLAQEMGGATGPRSAGGLEPTYSDGYYNGYNQTGELSPGGVGGGVRALKATTHTP